MISHIEGNEAGLWTLQVIGTYEEAAGLLSDLWSWDLALLGSHLRGSAISLVWNEQEQCSLLRRSVRTEETQRADKGSLPAGLQSPCVLAGIGTS